MVWGKGKLALIYALDHDLQISTDHIKLRENCGFAERIDEFIHVWNRVDVLLVIAFNF